MNNRALDEPYFFLYTIHMKCNTCNKEYAPDCDYNQGRCPHHPPLIDLKGIKMEIQPKDPSKAHFWASMIKSINRIAAFAVLYQGNFQLAAILLFTAEMIGIAEEIV